MTTFERIQGHVTSGDADLVMNLEVCIGIDRCDDDVDLVNFFKKHIKVDDFAGVKNGAHVDVIYKGQTHTIVYPNNYANRNTTLIRLNEIINDEYDIRWILDSNGSDTLAFLILEHKEWDMLEKQFGLTLHEYYSKLKRSNETWLCDLW